MNLSKPPFSNNTVQSSVKNDSSQRLHKSNTSSSQKSRRSFIEKQGFPKMKFEQFSSEEKKSKAD